MIAQQSRHTLGARVSGEWIAPDNATTYDLNVEVPNPPDMWQEAATRWLGFLERTQQPMPRSEAEVRTRVDGNPAEQLKVVGFYRDAVADFHTANRQGHRRRLDPAVQIDVTCFSDLSESDRAYAEELPDARADDEYALVEGRVDAGERLQLLHEQGNKHVREAIVLMSAAQRILRGGGTLNQATRDRLYDLRRLTGLPLTTALLT